VAWQVCGEYGLTPAQVADLSFEQIERLAVEAERKRAKHVLGIISGVAAAMTAYRFGSKPGDEKWLESEFESLRKRIS
jgi:hypothetical protein